MKATAQKLFAVLTILVAMTVVPVVAVDMQEGCAAAQAVAQVALSAADLGCIFSSTETDESKLAAICKIVQPDLTLLHELIGQREAAKKSGTRWGSAVSLDAGAGADAARR